MLNVLDKVTKSLEGDGHGGGPVADVLNNGTKVVEGNGGQIKSALDELSRALRLSSDGGAQTREQITTIVKNISTLFDAVAANDGKLREFASTIHQVSQIMADEDIGSGSTGRSSTNWSSGPATSSTPTATPSSRLWTVTARCRW